MNRSINQLRSDNVKLRSDLKKLRIENQKLRRDHNHIIFTIHHDLRAGYATVEGMVNLIIMKFPQIRADEFYEPYLMAIQRGKDILARVIENFKFKD